MFNAIVGTFVVLFGGVFAFLLGAAFMTGCDLSQAVNMICFLAYNAFVLSGVVIALKEVWTKTRDSDADL